MAECKVTAGPGGVLKHCSSNWSVDLGGTGCTEWVFAELL